MHDDNGSAGTRRPRPEAAHDEAASAADNEADAVSRLLVSSFPPVAPDPQVWEAVEAATSRVTVVEGDRSQVARHRRWFPLVAVAAALMLTVGSVAVFSARGGRDPFADAVVRELTDPVSGTVAMTIRTNEDGSASATAVDLPPLDGESTYQLWSVVGDEVVSVAVLGGEPDVAMLRIEGDPAVLALTVEASGGVAVSTRQPVAVWQPPG
jgi:Anti-sigma-K factor rskA, C-terminal